MTRVPRGHSSCSRGCAIIKKQTSNNENSASTGNCYEDIINRLERKYYAQAKFSSDSEDDSSSSTGSRDYEGTGTEKAKPTGKKKKDDDYDMDDEFICDDELEDEFNNILKAKKAKTKHGGFFVSCGVLEVTCIFES